MQTWEILAAYSKLTLSVVHRHAHGHSSTDFPRFSLRALLSYEISYRPLPCRQGIKQPYISNPHLQVSSPIPCPLLHRSPTTIIFLPTLLLHRLLSMLSYNLYPKEEVLQIISVVPFQRTLARTAPEPALFLPVLPSCTSLPASQSSFLAFPDRMSLPYPRVRLLHHQSVYVTSSSFVVFRRLSSSL